jgi:peptidoglycan-associated lipoprotein
MERLRRQGWVLGVVLAAAAVALAGCPKTPEVGETSPRVTTETVTPRPTPSPGESKREEVRVVPPQDIRDTTTTTSQGDGRATGSNAGASPLKDIFFDYDAATLTDDGRRALAEDVTWLKANPPVRITVEGHCDERGTSEYNLALGERRAKAVVAYLTAAGIEASRLRTISFGKERPFAPGHDESAWRQNRRAHFTIDR